MPFCPHCGTKVAEEFENCPSCGKEIPHGGPKIVPIRELEKEANDRGAVPTLDKVALVFMFLSAVWLALVPFTLIYTIPMCIHAYRVIMHRKRMGTAFKIFVLLLFALLPGILLLVREEPK